VKHTRWEPTLRSVKEYADALWSAFVHAEEFGIATINSLEFLKRYARQAAERMVTGLYFRGARTWREAAAESGKTGLMYRALSQELQGLVGLRARELIRESAGLISAFPESVARVVAAQAAAHAAAGGRAKELAGELPSLARVARSRAQLIARTQVSKASTALTEARAESLDLPWYVWETSSDQRVRLSHRKMQGVLFRWDDPPAPEQLIGKKSEGRYAPGDIYNCRCYPAPLVTLNQINWPHKAYVQWQIKYVTRSQFENMNGMRRAA
jgi:SPP1 gp7 family putative phage head morphogenesis protein